MKPEYEKPIAVPLGEALRGSGECNAGSAVMPSAGTSSLCQSGNMASGTCALGTANGAVGR